MKKFTGLIIILLALILGAYYSMGVLTERTIRKNIEVIDQSNGLYAEIEHYNRGFFRTDAEVKWRLHVPERVIKDAKEQVQAYPAQDYMIKMPLTVYHGPIIFTDHRLRFGLGYAQTVFSFPEQYKPQFDALFTQDSIKPQLDLAIFINYANHSLVDFKVPAFTLIAKDGSGRFEWLGLDSFTKMSSRLEKVAGKVVLNGLNASKDESKISFSKITTDYDLHETPAGLYLGDVNFALPVFNVFIKDQKLFEINDLIVKSDSDIEQHLFNAHFNFTFKSILANGQNYGPGNLDLALRNLDADILAKINQQTAVMQNGNDIQRQQALLSLLPELPKLFSKGAELEISKLSLLIPEGQIEGNLYVTIPKGENTNPLEMIQKIQGKAMLQVPSEAVKQIMQQSLVQQMAKQPELQKILIQQLQVQVNQPTTQIATPTSPLTNIQLAAIQTEKQLNALIQSGLITVQGSNYIVGISLDNGQFTVNGKPYDSSMMQF